MATELTPLSSVTNDNIGMQHDILKSNGHYTNIGRTSPLYFKHENMASAFERVEGNHVGNEDRRDLFSNQSSFAVTSAPMQVPWAAPTIADYQTPSYFPPPFNPIPHQPPQFHAIPFNHDPYGHINGFQAPQQHYPQLHSDRGLSQHREIIQNLDGGQPHHESHYGGMVKTDYSIPGGVQHIGFGDHESSMMNMHHEGEVHMMNDDSEDSLEHSENVGSNKQSVIRKLIHGPKMEANKIMMIPGHDHTTPMDVFCAVPGRLALLSSTSKYKATLAEVQRRLNPPECINASLLGGILRRAKSKNGGRSLREKLDKMGMNLPSGRRKAANVTLFTSLVEGEAIRLARDYGYLCETEFPAKGCAEHNSHQYTDPTDQMTRKNMVLATKQVLKELMDLLNQDRSPLGNTRPQMILEPNIQRHLSHFSLITHGFGSPAVVASLTAVQTYLNEMLKMMDPNMQKGDKNGK